MLSQPATTFRVSNPSRGRIRLRWGLGFLAFAGAYVCLALAVWNWGTTDRAHPAEAIVIFGAKVLPDGDATIALRERTRHAFNLWKRGLAPLIVCTGGIGDNPPAESVVEERLLLGWGVPAQVILTEHNSHNTRENVRFGAAALRGRLGNAGQLRIIAVSDAYHLWRAQRDCAILGLVAYTSPTTSDEPHANLRYQFSMALRELLSIARDLVGDGWEHLSGKPVG